MTMLHPGYRSGFGAGPGVADIKGNVSATGGEVPQCDTLRA
jgi:hypothetical protein